MADNEYQSAGPYAAHLRRTNEKQKLHEHIRVVCENGEFPLQKKGAGEILDVGSGNGVNAKFLAEYFPNCQVVGIEPSSAQYRSAVRRIRGYKNLAFVKVGIEHVIAFKKFDFILISHVLQYLPIYVTPKSVATEICEILRPGGEAWFIQQTKTGMAQIIQYMRPFLKNPRFRNWLTLEDYEPMIRGVAEKNGCATRVDYLDSSLAGIDFANPSEEDKRWLKFVLLLKGEFDNESPEFKRHLAELNLNRPDGRISHPNGIIKISTPDI